MRVEIQKTKISFYSVSLSFSFLFFFSPIAWPWEEKEESRREEGHCLLLDFWSVFIGLGSVVLRVQASSCFSSFVLSKVCPMHWGFVWGGRRHITFCLLSQAGGWGDWGGVYNRGGTKSKLIEGRGSSKPWCTKAYKALLHAELCQM